MSTYREFCDAISGATDPALDALAAAVVSAHRGGRLSAEELAHLVLAGKSRRALLAWLRSTELLPEHFGGKP